MMWNVLVFPCGSEIGLEAHNALRFNKDVHLVGLSSTDCHGKMVYKDYIEGISFINSDSFIDELNEIIDKNDIDFIIPAYDDVILFLANNAKKINCRILTSNVETCDVCRSKKTTYQRFKNTEFVPKTYDIRNVKKADLPIFAKPDIGQGSQGIAVIKTMDEVRQWQDSEGYVFCELLTGKEYTIDCFSDGKGNLVYMSMRERSRTKTGISVSSKTNTVPIEIRKIGEELNNELCFDGVWFFQVKIDRNGKYKLLEMAPRIAGSMSTSRATGFNYILNSIYQAAGYSIKPIKNPLKNVEIDRALITRYNFDNKYSTVYLDFDDTVTLKGKVNPWTMCLIYQWQRDEKDIIILTRHKKKIEETLSELHISRELFKDIIEIREEENKSKYVDNNDAIFIDDSFRERMDVSAEKGIPVFDVDGIEALLDWRF